MFTFESPLLIDVAPRLRAHTERVGVSHPPPLFAPPRSVFQAFQDFCDHVMTGKPAEQVCHAPLHAAGGRPLTYVVCVCVQVHRPRTRMGQMPRLASNAGNNQDNMRDRSAPMTYGGSQEVDLKAAPMRCCANE